jgi:hypothetical protein
MIDWVMLTQTDVALFIYRVGRSCPARNPFTARNSQGPLNSTRTRGPPIRPVRPTSQTDVAVAGSATRRPTGQTVEGHRSDRWRQPDALCQIWVRISSYNTNNHIMHRRWNTQLLSNGAMAGSWLLVHRMGTHQDCC